MNTKVFIAYKEDKDNILYAGSNLNEAIRVLGGEGFIETWNRGKYVNTQHLRNKVLANVSVH